MSAKKYMTITSASKATATRDLQDLAKKNILVPTGGGRSTRYQISLWPQTNSQKHARFRKQLSKPSMHDTRSDPDFYYLHKGRICITENKQVDVKKEWRMSMRS